MIAHVLSSGHGRAVVSASGSYLGDIDIFSGHSLIQRTGTFPAIDRPAAIRLLSAPKALFRGTTTDNRAHCSCTLHRAPAGWSRAFVELARPESQPA